MGSMLPPPGKRDRGESTASLTGTLAVRRRTNQEKRLPWSSSKAQTCIFILAAVLAVAIMAGVTIMSIIASDCLMFQLVTPIQCDYNLTSLKYYTETVAATYSACLTMLVISIATLLGCSAKQNQPIYFVVLPVKQIWAQLRNRRKFYIQLFLLIVTESRVFYMSFKIMEARANAANTSDRVLQEFRGNSYIFALVQILLVVLMCMLNYSRQAKHSAHLTTWGFRLVLAALFYFQLHRFLECSFHLSFKIAPNARAQHKPGAKKDVDAIGSLLVSGSAAFAAFTCWFFFTKMFKPHKDLFRPVYDEMPREGDDESNH
ncbi:uncharacterized protein LOC135809711 [Sycon ciliatum]|uniref:uncharacterized protein LOC135809711 n=1 Tax=Sycon ciliatum TaxID=27933 RepID=UPI0031F7094C